jgi:hypothetical protein
MATAVIVASLRKCVAVSSVTCLAIAADKAASGLPVTLTLMIGIISPLGLRGVCSPSEIFAIAPAL